MGVIATSAEELALILEPFPFMSDETKAELVEASQGLFDFMNFLKEKHPGVKEDVIQARLDMKINATLAEMMVTHDKDLEALAEDDSDDGTEFVKKLMGEVMTKVAEDEGYEGGQALKEAAEAIMGIQKAMETHIEKLIAEGKEEELKNFVELMEKQK